METAIYICTRILPKLSAIPGRTSSHTQFHSDLALKAAQNAMNPAPVFRSTQIVHRRCTETMQLYRRSINKNIRREAC